MDRHDFLRVVYGDLHSSFVEHSFVYLGEAEEFLCILAAKYIPGWNWKKHFYSHVANNNFGPSLVRPWFHITIIKYIW
jgi:hypothetical protein